jgi:import inner membrane translocase subunit TIM44
MLPRHLQSLALRPCARNRVLLSRKTVYPPPFRINPPSHVGFHSSSRHHNELPKSPFQTFVEVLRDELRKNRELQDNVKQLQGDVDKLQDSEAMKKARAAYERARVRKLCSLYQKDELIRHCITAHVKHQGKPAPTSSC